MMGQAKLKIDSLTTSLKIKGQWYEAVRDVSLSIAPRETVALVGESGCGKSLTALSVMGLLPQKIAAATGSITVDGENILELSEARRAETRGKKIGMIFQDPMTSLNPVLPIGFQITEALVHHHKVSRAKARERAIELLELVRIPSASDRLEAYPHQFSGGMRQRVMIAMALACSPKIVIADEPTTALDVTIQAQVLALLKDLQEKENLAVLLITHNLGVVASVADRVMVMYGGDVVESAPVREFFADPVHPYSQGLLAAMPRVDMPGQDLAAIPGRVPTLTEMPSGCRFQSRCSLKKPECAERPPLAAIGGGADHFVRCWVRTEHA